MISRRGMFGARWRILTVVAAFMLAVTGCSGVTDNSNPGGSSPDQSDTEATDTSSDELSVIVSLPFFSSMVEAVGGDRVTVDSLVPQGADPHSYQPSPGDAQAIADANVIFINGRQLEEWMSGLIESAGGVDAPVHELSDGLNPLESEHDDDEHDAGDHDEDADHEEHEHGAGDPHFWLNPQYGIHYVEQIAEVLSALDPDNADFYQENAGDYIAELEEFDTWAEEEIAAIPAENRKLVTFHEAFAYFADRYDLEITGVIIQSPGREPGAQEIARLVDEIQEQNVPAIFVEPQFNQELADTLANEAGVETRTMYSDSPPEDTGYLEMMRLNVESVVEGLS